MAYYIWPERGATIIQYYNQLIQRGYTFLNVTRLNQYCSEDIRDGQIVDKIQGPPSFIAELVLRIIPLLQSQLDR